MDVTMLNEEEYAIAYDLYGSMVQSRGQEGSDEFRKKLIDYYFNLTGEMDSNPNSIMHHRIALYGPPCEQCGKPYRTAKASFCAACGNKRSSV